MVGVNRTHLDAAIEIGTCVNVFSDTKLVKNIDMSQPFGDKKYINTIKIILWYDVLYIKTVLIVSVCFRMVFISLLQGIAISFVLQCNIIRIAM